MPLIDLGEQPAFTELMPYNRIAIFCVFTVMAGCVLTTVSYSEEEKEDPSDIPFEDSRPFSVVSLQQAVKVADAPSVSGEFSKGEWEDAPVYDEFYAFDTEKPTAPPVRTSVRVAFHDTGVFLAIRCHEEDPEEISATHEGSEMWRDDSVEIYFSPGPDAPEDYRKFVVNAAGNMWAEARDRDISQDGGADKWGISDEVREELEKEEWEAHAGRDEQGWHATVHIPREALGHRAQSGELWRFALIRYSYTDGNRFTTTSRKARFDNPNAFGYLHFGVLNPEEKQTMERLGKAISGNWVVPLGERCIINSNRVLRVADGEIFLRERKEALTDNLKAAQKQLGPEDDTLKKAAQNLEKELQRIPIQASAVPELAAAVKRMNDIRAGIERLKTDISISGPRDVADKGVKEFLVESPYTRGENEVQVLLPDDFDPERTYRTLYVLPVNEGIGGRWGDGLQTLKETDLHNTYDLICVSMAFANAPWYGNHATDPSIRHEEYIKEVIVPLVEERYPVEKKAEGRLLLGFSKSGWGAFSMLLRDPDFFGYAASWDAPLIMDEDAYGIWDTDSHFGTVDNYMDHLPIRWAEKNADRFRDERPRLVLLGHNLFGEFEAAPKNTPHTRTFHQRLRDLEIPHEYDNDIGAPHSWNREWLEPAIRKLMELVENGSDSADSVP